MGQRSDDWLSEYGDLIRRNGFEVRRLILSGFIEICPGCRELSAYAWDDCDDYDDKPSPGMVAHIGCCSGFEWRCGHCGTHWMDADSPLNHPAYTH